MSTASAAQSQVVPPQAINFTVPDPKRTNNLSLPLYHGAGFNTEYKAWQLLVPGGFMQFNLELPEDQNIRLTLDECSMNVDGKSNNPYTITVNHNYTLITNFDDHGDHFHEVSFLITKQWLHAGANSIVIKLDSSATTKVSFKSVGVAGIVG
ncbi:MAG TPA: hypothetical protein VFK06_15730 [Candidatus Angelobacter sp.]|nr:hypothetical protein [Candidatus Angelobacter sp.]